MNSREVLLEAFGRIRTLGEHVVDGLTAGQVAVRPGEAGNSVAWLVWHLARIQDDHVADVAGTGQLWTGDGWAERFALPLEPGDTGYGHTPAQVASVRVADPALLRDYLLAVTDRTLEYVRGLTDADLDRVVDTRWDPPVTLGVRLVSVVGDDLQHLGQAAYVRGLVTD